jgi:23S rRNA (cytosine1962-C5)-methyltransferase
MLQIIISKKSAELIKKGFPWVYADDVVKKNSALEIARAGELADLIDEKGKFIAKAYINSNSKIIARILTLDKKENIDKSFFVKKITYAISRRKKFFRNNYFRAIYSESDFLPGLIIDLYGEHAVAQVNSAGMENLQKFWLPAFVEVVGGISGVYLDASSKHREREGLSLESKVIFGDIPNYVEVLENDIKYYADIVNGQKTGWFYDQRSNRKFLSLLVGNKSMLDLYTHSGGFGLLSAANHASKVTMVDRSDLSLSLAEQTARANKLQCSFINDDVFDFLDNNISAEKYDIVNADPPAFAKSKKDVEVGMKGYEKLTKKCLPLVKEEGIFAISSCSYFVRPEQFQKAVETAIEKSGRYFELLRKSGADKDHPIHPMLSETNYLKFLVYKLD